MGLQNLLIFTCLGIQFSIPGILAIEKEAKGKRQRPLRTTFWDIRKAERESNQQHIVYNNGRRDWMWVTSHITLMYWLWLKHCIRTKYIRQLNTRRPINFALISEYYENAPGEALRAWVFPPQPMSILKNRFSSWMVKKQHRIRKNPSTRTLYIDATDGVDFFKPGVSLPYQGCDKGDNNWYKMFRESGISSWIFWEGAVWSLLLVGCIL